MNFSSFKKLLIWCILLGMISGVTWVAFHYDRPTRNYVISVQGKKFKKTPLYKNLGLISKYGDWPQIMIFGACLLGLAWWKKRRDWMQVIMAAMVASTLAGLIVVSLRSTTGRPRPRDEAKLGTTWYGPRHGDQWLIGKSSYNSFPSGHSATAFGFAVVFLFARPWAGLILLIPAFSIILSRVGLGAHHLSDVTVGAIIASLVAWFTWKWFKQYGEARIPFLKNDKNEN